ncbi:hypothetical protein DPEC_G00354880 [Dallia pectoralis]|uniref:Uncharacterized protein n=1 Tax=Dallia pectoralis TaxID=75939 RepID=A0ACC2EZC0_DALPE|nr:hypothetical protein DPEC_G00354880 [Dallia pectoralis]
MSRAMAGCVVLRGLMARYSRLFDSLTPTACVSVWTRPVQTRPVQTRPVPTHRTCPVRKLHLCPNFYAGHNKWSKVKHVKGPKDAARSRMFMKFAMMIRIAVKDGGSSNPEFNVALANVVEQCREKNMPKASIEAAIKGAEKSKTGTQHTYEARGPAGYMLLIDILTDNNTRSLQDVRYLLNKHSAALCDGARHSFMRKGVVVALGEGVSCEQALELAIEVGAEDVQEMDEEDEKPTLRFVCGLSEQKKVRTSLEELGVHTLSSSLEFIPNAPTKLSQDQLEAAFSLIEALNDYPDVVRVWDNIQS